MNMNKNMVHAQKIGRINYPLFLGIHENTSGTISKFNGCIAVKQFIH